MARNITSDSGTSRFRAETGFSLVDVLMTVTLLAIVAGMAVAGIQNVGESIRLGTTAREVASELQTARLKAVTSNRTMRLRFNCPVAGKYRMVEVLGSVADGDIARCNPLEYPFPAPDQSPITVPNHDGPSRQLPTDISFGAFKTLDFRPDGSVYEQTGLPLAGGETAITLVKGENQKRITVNSLGKILLQ